jgi:hypothetical protein
LLPRRVQHPLLRLRIDDLRRYAVEPRVCESRVTDAAPQFSDQVGQHRPLVARNAVEGRQRLVELPRGLATEEALGLDITFVDAAPRGAQQEVRHVPRLHPLPLGHLGRGFVLL